MTDALRRNGALVGFFAKLLAAYLAWFVLYDLWLLPAGRLDAAVSEHVAAAVGGLLRLVGVGATVEGRVVRLASGEGVEIADGCNGLSSLGLFAGFVLAFPGAWRRRAWFLPLGLVAVYLTNVARVLALLLLLRGAPALFDAVHGFGATTVFYVVVFALWVAWARASGEGPARERVLRVQPAGARA